MTAEEIDIIVEANVEKALKEFQKLLPAIKKQLSGIQKEFEKVNIKDIKASIDMSQVTKKVKQAKKQIKEAFDPNVVSFTINAKKEIAGISKEFNKLSGKKIDLGNAVEIKSYNDKLSKTAKIAEKTKEAVSSVGFVKYDANAIEKQIKEAMSKVKQAFNPEDISDMTINGKAFDIKSIKGYSKEVQKLKGQMGTLNKFKPETLEVEVPKVSKIQTPKMQTPKTENTGQANQYSVWTNMLRKYYAMLDMAKVKMTQLKQQTEQTGASQGKLASFFGGFRGKMEQVNSLAQSMRNIFSKIPNITKIATNHIKKMGTGIKTGLGHVLKYVGALLSLRGIYSILSNSAQSWLSSQNKGAQQLSANIEYMKYAMGSAFAPVIQYVINLVYQLMKAIQSLVYAFSGVNIFAKATASSMGKTAKSAKETNKSLAGVHNEINNVSEKDNSSGGGSVSPSMDLSKLDAQMNPFAQKLHDFFKPLVDSWNTYGAGLIAQVKVTASQIGGLIASVWGSFENIITNGTVYSILHNILAIIGNIAEAFSNAWNYNGNGDAIVQSLANAFNNLLNAINNIVKSEGFQNFLKWCSDKFREIAEKIESIDWQPLMDALSVIGENIGTIALEILSGLVDIFKWLAENPIVAEILLAIAIAIGVVSTALTIASSVVGFFTMAMDLLNISLLPPIGIIVGIIAVVALIVLAIMNWNTIMEWLKQTVETVVNAVVEFFTNLWSKVSFIFEAIWNVISTVFNAIWEVVSTILGFIWNLIATVFQAIWNIVSPIINAIWQIISTIFQAIWSVISTVLSSVWNVFSQIFNWIWELTSRIFQGIWDIISPIMSAIWNGIKTALSWIQQIWSNVWNGIATIVSNVWNGIWGCIKGVINAILGGIENMVNGVIKGVNWILSGISNIANAIGGLVGMKPINLKLNLISLPRLAKGNVAYSPLIAQFGEYAGASHNPEITTPQNIMAETFEDVLSSHEWNNSSNSKGEIKQLIFQFGSYRVAMEMESLLRQARRQNGTATVNI